MRAQEFVLEDKMATLTVGGMRFMVDPHILDQVVLRFVLPSDVDRILKKMSTIRSELDVIEPGQQFWVYSPTLDVAVGMRKGLSGSFLLKTALANRPWQSDTPTLTVQENFADGHTPADAVLDYVKRKHHDFRMDREILMYPRWQLTEIPLGNLIIADYTDSDIDLDQVDVVKRDPERKINQSPIIVDPAGAIIDGNHRAFAARELGMTHIPAWRPVEDLDENFADGRVKGRSRPGRVKRAGASCKGSVTDLRARAKKYGGERGRMYHWCANMKSGRKQSN